MVSEPSDASRRTQHNCLVLPKTYFVKSQTLFWGANTIKTLSSWSFGYSGGDRQHRHDTISDNRVDEKHDNKEQWQGRWWVIFEEKPEGTEDPGM